MSSFNPDVDTKKITFVGLYFRMTQKSDSTFYIMQRRKVLSKVDRLLIALVYLGLRTSNSDNTTKPRVVCSDARHEILHRVCSQISDGLHHTDQIFSHTIFREIDISTDIYGADMKLSSNPSATARGS